MTLKPFDFGANASKCFGTILNNMTLKHELNVSDSQISFGTILNNMTLKQKVGNA